MTELALQQPELIGREEELNKLKKSLDNAIAGKGSTIFIAGEAGIGKTRLVSELIKEAESKDVQLIQGWCLAESLEPLMPIKTALREAGLFHLISGDPPPLVVSTYLINNAGLLIAKAEKEELDLDPYIFTSMLNAVGNFVKDSMQMVDQVERTGGLNILGYKKFKIIIEEYDELHLATVTKGSLSEFLVNDMREALVDVQRRFGDVLSEWDGDLDKVVGIEKIVSRLVTSGKYGGKFLVDNPKIRQENIFDNVLLGLQRLSSERPLLLVLDDLQWTDPTTLNMLHYLARNTRQHRVTIIGAYRPEEVVQSWEGITHQLVDAMQKMSRDDLLEKIELKRLDSSSTKKIVESTLGTISFENTFLDKIYKETEGNPFFILEVIKLLAEENVLVQDDEEAWNLTADIETIDIPSKVYDVVKRRLDRLIKEQRKILECASVVGEEFKSDLVSKVVRLDKLQLLENLSEIEKTHRLIHSFQKKYKFDHAKIREVLYNGIIDELKEEYHRIIADTIAELHKDEPDEIVDQLAYHYFEAKDERAGGYLIKAGDQAKERFANEEAIRSYNNALTVLKDEEKLKAVHEDLGDVYSLIGEYDKALENYKYTIEKENDIRKKADLHRRIAGVYKNLDNIDARLEECEKGLELLKDDECIEKARLLGVKGFIIQNKSWSWKGVRELFYEELKIAEKLNDKKEIAQAHNNIGILYFEDYTDDSMKEGISHYEKALAIREDIEDIIGLSETLSDIGLLYHNRGNMYPIEGNWDKAIEYYKKSMKIKQKIGDKEGIAWIILCIAILHRNRDELDEALELYEDCLEINKKIGKNSKIAQTLYFIGYNYSLTGDVIKALDYYEQSYKIVIQTERKSMIADYLSRIGEIYENMGELDKALDIYNQCIDLCDSTESDNKDYVYYFLRAKGNVYKHKGELDKALKNHEKSFEINSKEDSQHKKRELISNHCDLAEVYIGLGDIAEAKAHAGKALDMSIELDSIYFIRMSYQTLAMVFREAGEWDKSLEYFEKAKIKLEASNFGVYIMKYDKSHLSYEYGFLFKAKGEPDKAKEHLNKALTGFEELSNKLWADKTQKVLEELNQ